MAIPRYDEIQFHALKLLSDGNLWKSKDMEIPLANFFKLTENEITQMYSSGNGPVFIDRINWALSYLNMAGVVQKPKRGIYKINEEGLKILKNPSGFRNYIDSKIDSREPTRKKKQESSVVSKGKDSLNDLTPEEALYESFEGIKKSISREIIDTILSKNPREFEKIVVQLLQKMGYGGEIENSGLVTQYSNDKGIDGVIKEDILGFGRINIQAKRYNLDNNVPREDIQKFVGALAVAQSNKGVFITTSSFNKNAIELSIAFFHLNDHFYFQ